MGSPYRIPLFKRNQPDVWPFQFIANFGEVMHSIMILLQLVLNPMSIKESSVKFQFSFVVCLL